MGRALEQAGLFTDKQLLPNGLLYRPDFISVDEEQALLALFGDLPFREARFQQYTARRRVMRFGDGSYLQNGEDDDFPRQEFPELLKAIRARIAAELGCRPGQFVHGLVTQYQSGTPIGWHRDAPHFEVVAGLSLASACRMRFRPWQSRDTQRALSIELQPRSLYVMRDEIRWSWQHHIPPARALRYSATFRTLRMTHGSR